MMIKLLFFLTLFFTVQINAEELKIDYDKSSIKFEIIKFKIQAPVEGQFNSYTVKTDYDEEKNLLKSVRTSIAVSSIDTKDEKRDKHLQNEDFFHSNKYPQITFESSESVILEGNFKMKGVLTIRDVSKSIVIDFKVLSSNDKEITLEGITLINRLDYKVSWNSSLEKSQWVTLFGKLGKFVLDDEVKIKLNIVLRKK